MAAPISLRRDFDVLMLRQEGRGSRDALQRAVCWRWRRSTTGGRAVTLREKVHEADNVQEKMDHVRFWNPVLHVDWQKKHLPPVRLPEKIRHHRGDETLRKIAVSYNVSHATISRF